MLSLIVTHFYTTMGMTHRGIPMTVTSALNAPPDGGYQTGTTTSDFTQSTDGHVASRAAG